MIVHVTGQPITDKEQQAYIDRGIRKYGEDLQSITIDVVNDEECKILYVL